MAGPNRPSPQPRQRVRKSTPHGSLPRPEDSGVTRPTRHYVGHQKIARHRGLDFNDPCCMGCGEGVDSWKRLERAHVIARHLGGLDGVQNLWLLCRPCHRGGKERGWMSMPDFAPGQEAAALCWLAAHPSWTDGVEHMLRMIGNVVDRCGGDEELARAALLGSMAVPTVEVDRCDNCGEDG